MKRWLPFLLLFLLSQTAAQAQDKIKDLLKLGWEQFEAKEFDAAYETCERARFLNPDAVDVFVLRGVLNACKYNTKSAMEDLSYAIKEGTKDYHAFLYRGRVFQLTEQYSYAEVDFQKAISMNGKDYLCYSMRGMMRIHAGKYQDAIKDLDKALEISPDNPSILAAKADGYFQRKDYRTALLLFQRAKDRGIVDVHSVEIYMGICAYYLEQYPVAESHFNNALAVNPQSTLALFNLGTIKEAQRELDAAQIYFDRAIATDRSYSDAYSHKGECFALTQNYDQCIVYLDTAIALGGENLKYNLVGRGNAKSRLLRYEPAIADYNLAVELDPAFLEGLYRRGRARLNLQQYNEATTDFRVCLTIDPKDKLSAFYLAYAQAHAGDNVGARQSYSEYLKKHPTDTGAWNNLAAAEKALGMCETALLHYAKALATSNGDSVTVYHDRASCYLELGDTNAANANLDSSIALHPPTGRLLSGVGYLLNCLNRSEEALLILNRSVTSDSTYAYAYNNRGFAKYKLGQYESAILDFDESIALKNDYFHWPPYNRANCHRALGRYKEAIADFDLALRYVQAYPEAYNDRGETWEKLGEKGKAIADYQLALQYKPDFAQAKQNLERLQR